MTMKLLKAGVAATISLLFMIGCSPTAHVEKTAGVDLGKYKTYSWVEEDKSDSVRQDRTYEMVQQNIRAAVDKELQQNGWRLTQNNPDALVSADLVVEKNSRQQQDAVYSQPFTRTYLNRYTGRLSTIYFPSRFMGYNSYTTTIKEGTVTVTLIDARTDKAVWQGWATDELAHNQPTGKEIDKNVRSIFKKFDEN